MSMMPSESISHPSHVPPPGAHTVTSLPFTIGATTFRGFRQADHCRREVEARVTYLLGARILYDAAQGQGLLHG